MKNNLSRLMTCMKKILNLKEKLMTGHPPQSNLQRFKMTHYILFVSNQKNQPSFQTWSTKQKSPQVNQIIFISVLKKSFVSKDFGESKIK